MKNLILLHLESLNLINYRSNPDIYKCLTGIEQNCLVFDRYFSTATSTFMVLADLLYGDMRQYECCVSLSDVPIKYFQKETLLDQLKKNGFTTGLWYFPNVQDICGAQRRNVAGFDNHIEVIASREDYFERLNKAIQQKPFAYMICNCTSNIALNHELDITELSWDDDYWSNAYRSMDQYCGELFEILKKNGLMENTIIVMYGDHGDDFWGHGFHGGLTHAIEPNNLLIRTPLLIWDGENRDATKHNETLIQTTDLKKLILSLIQEEHEMDLPERKYAISRNAYAAQPVRADTFNKAYTITDGRYLLLVSVQGLEMYDTFMDPSCMNDLLRLFEFDNEILRAKPIAEKYHFDIWWDVREQRIVRNKFYELKSELHESVKELYEAGGITGHRMENELNFGHAAFQTYQ